MRTHYEELLGLLVQEVADQDVYLSTGPEHHCLVLQPAEYGRLDRIALALSTETDLEETKAALQRLGVPCRVLHDPGPGIAWAIDLDDPAGNSLRLHRPIGEPGPGPSRRGIAPEKLGHVACRVEEVAAISDWYQRVLGLKVADWIGDFFVFLRCGVEHHVLNFIRAQPAATMHHVAYQVSDPPQLLAACDQLARYRVPVIWGPGRHGAGHNMFVYYRDPDDHIVELFCQLDVMLDESLGYYDPRPWHVDVPQRPKVWDDHLAGANLWGIGPPPEMRRAPKETVQGAQP
jgi:catechol 2,3-dioxygenase-like lactoylglutathione lyase family enzyme